MEANGKTETDRADDRITLGNRAYSDADTQVVFGRPAGPQPRIIGETRHVPRAVY
jgi:hypothetical protein